MYQGQTSTCLTSSRFRGRLEFLQVHDYFWIQLRWKVCAESTEVKGNDRKGTFQQLRWRRATMLLLYTLVETLYWENESERSTEPHWRGIQIQMATCLETSKTITSSIRQSSEWNLYPLKCFVCCSKESREHCVSLTLDVTVAIWRDLYRLVSCKPGADVEWPGST